MHPKLIYAPLPPLGRRKKPDGVEYKYEKYIPVVEEFLLSNEPSGRVESDEKGLIGHVHNAIFHSSARGEVEACVRGGKVWLRRKL